MWPCIWAPLEYQSVNWASLTDALFLLIKTNALLLFYINHSFNFLLSNIALGHFQLSIWHHLYTKITIAILVICCQRWDSNGDFRLQKDYGNYGKLCQQLITLLLWSNFALISLFLRCEFLCFKMCHWSITWGLI